jgi:hypothetical protein
VTLSRQPENGTRIVPEQPLWIRVGIPLSCGFFIFALAVACLFDPSVRILHPLQALIYVAIIILAHRSSPWGFGAGCFIAAYWNFLFLRGSAANVAALLSGRVFRPDVALQFAAAVAHFLLFAACFAGMWRLRSDGKRWLAFIASGSLTITYFLILITLIRPQYLELIRRVFGLR